MSKRSNACEIQPEFSKNPSVVFRQNRSVYSHPDHLAAPCFSYELPRARWNHYGFSVVLHVIVVTALILILSWLPKPRVQPEKTAHLVIPLIAPDLTQLAEPAPTPPPLPKQLPPPVKPAVIPPVAQPPKVQPARVEPTPQPPVEIAKVPEREMPKPPAKKEVVMDRFDSGSSAPVTTKEPERKVQTGGFGNPNGVEGTAQMSAKLTAPHVGSFDMPAGPGSGNGTAGAHGIRGTVASAGFGDGVASPVGGHRGTVTSAGFGEMPTTTGPKARAEDKPALNPVEILSKPRPVYTEEARRLRIEGEVLLEVMFTASGELKVQRIVKSLGHGLDEAALRAAQQIRFKPAKRDGQPYDSVALVHINFELAE